MIITEWEIFEVSIKCCDAFVCSVMLEAWSRCSHTPAVPISSVILLQMQAIRTMMAEDVVKDRLSGRCDTKLRVILPLINSIIKSSIFEVIFSY